MLHSFISNKKSFSQDVSRQELAHALWEKEPLIWVDLENPSDFETEILVELFSFHPLAVEDCLIDHSEPKIDDYDDHLFLVVHSVSKNDEDEITTDELNIFVSRNYVVTFHRKPIPAIQYVRDAVARKQGSQMTGGVDMLVHLILDQLVDRYFPVLNNQERQIDMIEDLIFQNDGQDVLQRILKIQKDILYLKRIIGPQRETISHLSRSARSFVKPKNLIYYRDIYDHLFKMYQMAEELHALINGILQVYYSHVSHQLNNVIKTMTVFATIALPMMVISGIYGMNFRVMPELNFEHGYWFALGLMFAVSGLLLTWMKFKKWL